MQVGTSNINNYTGNGKRFVFLLAPQQFLCIYQVAHFLDALACWQLMFSLTVALCKMWHFPLLGYAVSPSLLCSLQQHDFVFHSHSWKLKSLLGLCMFRTHLSFVLEDKFRQWIHFYDNICQRQEREVSGVLGKGLKFSLTSPDVVFFFSFGQ